jgi:hypothetical protein
MRRTLLAVGFAVLVSMLFAPHQHYWGVMADVFYVQPVKAKYLSTDPRVGPNLAGKNYKRRFDRGHLSKIAHSPFL